MNFFGRKKKTNIISPSDSINNLKTTITLLEKRESYLNKQVDNLRSKAKEELKKNDKNRALNYLKKSKLYEKQIDSIFANFCIRTGCT